MRRRGAWTALAATAIVSSAAPAQDVTTSGPTGKPITEGTPRFTITTAGFTAAQLPLQLRLQVSVTADFAGPFLADTTVTGSQATIVIPRLLPEETQIWWRTIARTAQGTLVAENATGPRDTSPWITLTSPNNRNGNTLTTTTPRFSWSAVTLHPPVAPWRFNLRVQRTDNGLTVVNHNGSDETHVPLDPLESNTSYFWSVSAVAGTGDSVRVVSFSTFVISSPNAPIATVMFQPFPNPFPNDRGVDRTCIWFDIKAQSDVSLEVLDLRGNHVRKILPSSELSTFTPGRFGREQFGSTAGCDGRFTWDGTDNAGRTVRPGVYLIKFRGDGLELIKRVLFRGR